MNIDRAVLIVAGTVVLTGLVLGEIFHPYWRLLSAFAGLNMLQAAVTGFCPAALIFRALGMRPGQAF